ncbi:MAG: tetratricopeptide repeat protein [Candidatus Hydrogenedentes bacterium]|nr:tetratricopeptide repeat protein [Candidatus Hydrogenedentota bacterium]
MNREILESVARNNWHLLLVIAVILGAVGYKLISGDGSATAPVASVVRPAAAQGVRTAAQTPRRDLAAEERAKAREATMALIRENEAALATNPEPDKAAAYVNGIGNMYFQRLQDYPAAASHFERAISDYPDAPTHYHTFIQLAMCYERMGDQEKRKATLRRMMESYPADSQQYAYAYSELYGEMPAQPAQAELDDTTAGPAQEAAEAATSAEEIAVAAAQ